jgi:hypothetical protein
MDLARSFNFTFRYIDDIHSLNNSTFVDFVDCIYPTELNIKDITDRAMPASYLDLHLEIDSDGRLIAKHYDKRDDLNFPILNFHLNVVAFQWNSLRIHLSVDTILQSLWFLSLIKECC